MKITLITPYFPYPTRGRYFGAERYNDNLALSLKKLGNEVKVVTTYWNGRKRFEYYKGIQILRVKDLGAIFKIFGPFDIFYYISFGLGVLRKKNFRFYCDSDVILLSTPILLFSKFFRIKNIPTISITFHI